VRVVRARGGWRELRVDGTFASRFRPGEAATGSVWDALALPVLALPPARRRRVLILGLGGGSAARLVRALAPQAAIVGIERDAGVLRAAHEHFDLAALGLEIVQDDALAYLERARDRFDLVIDDVFVGRGLRVRKPEWLPEPGLGLAARRLAPGGLLVANALDDHRATARALCRRFPAVLSVRVEGYDNRILVGAAAGLDARRLRAAVAAEPALAATLRKLGFLTVQGGRGFRNGSRPAV
jgi:spermidine synthase